MSALSLPTPQLAGDALVSPSPFVLRGETPVDVAAREAVLDKAMGPGRTRKSSEAIRRGRLPAVGLSFVAIEHPSDRVVGTVRLWHVAAGGVEALLLGPLAVLSEVEGNGLGSALMRHAIVDARRCGHQAIVLVGEPEYYARFGFCAAHASGLAMPGPFERHRLLGLELVPGALRDAQVLVVPTGRPDPA